MRVIDLIVMLQRCAPESQIAVETDDTSFTITSLNTTQTVNEQNDIETEVVLLLEEVVVDPDP